MHAHSGSESLISTLLMSSRYFSWSWEYSSVGRAVVGPESGKLETEGLGIHP